MTGGREEEGRKEKKKWEGYCLRKLLIQRRCNCGEESTRCESRRVNSKRLRDSRREGSEGSEGEGGAREGKRD